MSAFANRIVKIDNDLVEMDVHELENYLCNIYTLPQNTFSVLTTTERLRLHCQVVRDSRVSRMDRGY